MTKKNIMKRFLLILLLLPSLLMAQDTLLIGTCVAPPFVIEEDGNYSGVCIELWDEIAKKLDIPYKLIDLSDKGFNNLVDAVKNGDIDMAATSLTINSKRASKVDFSQPYYITGLSIATAPGGESSWTDALFGIFSWSFFSGILSLVVLLVFMGLIFWFVERRDNDAFDDTAVEGVANGAYFAWTVMTTVGFGDISPRTMWGKIIYSIWALVTLIITSVLIGNISSSMTVNRIESQIESLDDLNKLKVATLKGSTGEDFLYKNKIKFIGYESEIEALNDIKQGRLDAFMYDRPTLQYYIEEEGFDKSVELGPEIYDKQYYGFAVPLDERSDIRNEINRTLLEQIKNSKWTTMLEKYNLN